MDLLRRPFASFRPTQPWRNLVIPFLREVVAMTTMCILLAIPGFSAVYGEVGYIMVVTIGAQARNQSIGKALRSSLVNICAAGASIAYSLMVGAILTAADGSSEASNTAISRWAALTIYMLFTTMLRARFQDMAVAHVISTVTVTVLLFSSVTQGLPMDTTIAISEPLLVVFVLAEAIALVCTCLIRPVIARREYRNSIANEFNTLGEILEGSLRLLLQQGSLSDTLALRTKIEKSRGSIPIIEQWQVEAALELGAPFWRAPQARTLVKNLYVTATTIHATAAFAMEHAQRLESFNPAPGGTQSVELFFGADAGEQPQLNLSAFAQFMGEDDDAVLLLPASKEQGSVGGELFFGADAGEQPQLNLSAFAQFMGEDDDAVLLLPASKEQGSVGGIEEGAATPDPVDQEIRETAQEEAAMTEGDAQAHRRLLERIGERVNTLVQAEVSALQTMRLIAIHDKKQDKDLDATGFATMTQMTEEIENLNHEDVPEAAGRGLRTIRVNYVLANLLELASQLEGLNNSVAEVFAPQPGVSLKERLKTTVPWEFFTNSTSEGRSDFRHAMLHNERNTDTDADANSIIPAKLWSSLSFLSSTEMRFAAKITFSFALILLICVLVSGIQDLYFTWALFSLVFTASPTMGGNLVNSIYRILGTILGGLLAAVVWYASTANPFGLVFLSLPIVFVAAYLKVATVHPRLGAQILIAFMIILYAQYGEYVRNVPSLHIMILLAFRVVNIIIGVTAVLISSRLIYPYVARTELRRRLGTTQEDLGVLHTHLIALFRDPYSLGTADNRLAKLAFLSTAIHLSQRDLYKAKALLVQSVNEPQLQKATFERDTFEKLIATSQHLLDLLVTCRSILVRSHNPALLGENEYFRNRILAPAHKERLQNFALADLSFYVLAAALKSKRPLPYYLPQTCAASSLLIRKLGSTIEQEQKHQDGAEHGVVSSRLLLNYFAFLCSVHMITLDLVQITSLVRRIAGVDHTLRKINREKSLF